MRLPQAIRLRLLPMSLCWVALAATGCGSVSNANPPEFAANPSATAIEVQNTDALRSDEPEPTKLPEGQASATEEPQPVTAPDTSDTASDTSGAELATPDTAETPRLENVNTESLMPDPASTVFRSSEAGYEITSSEEIPVVDFDGAGIEVARLMYIDNWTLPICYDADRNPHATFISTTEGVRCGRPIDPFATSDAENWCRWLFPKNELVELDPQLRTSQPTGESWLMTQGCATPITQDGVDRHFAELGSDG